ncbi:MAG: hypothetical protein U9O96_08345 [Candidatus Thermoplasmatota archaeon]|nr:hypothetical protein [Candidatus Thermoplasmatota archaeon]
MNFEVMHNRYSNIICENCNHYVAANDSFIRLHLQRKDGIGYRADLCSLECLKSELKKREIAFSSLKQIGKNGFVKLNPGSIQKIYLDKVKKMNENEDKKEKEKERKPPVTTLLNEAKGKQVQVMLADGEPIRGMLKKFSIYELEVGNKIIWKQSVKYLKIEGEGK